MKKKTYWNFTYKGIICEVVNWSFESQDDYFKQEHPTGNWNGYIYIYKKQLPRQFSKLLVGINTHRFGKKSPLRKFWDYSKLEDYFDMHGGITYYELLRDEFTGEPTGVKVGCDYLHSWDSGMHYTNQNVERDLKNSVDTFISAFPNYLVWDMFDGKYRKLADLKHSEE